MVDMNIHRVKKIIIAPVRYLEGTKTYVRHISIETEDQGFIDIIVYADDKEALEPVVV